MKSNKFTVCVGGRYLLESFRLEKQGGYKVLAVLLIATMVVSVNAVGIFAKDETKIPQLSAGETITRTSVDGERFTFRPTRPGRYNIELIGPSSDKNNGQSSMKFKQVLSENDEIEVYLGPNIPECVDGAGYQKTEEPYYSELLLNGLSVAIAGGVGGRGGSDGYQYPTVRHDTAHECGGRKQYYGHLTCYGNNNPWTNCSCNEECRSGYLLATGSYALSIYCTASEGGGAGEKGGGLYVTGSDGVIVTAISATTSGKGKVNSSSGTLALPNHTNMWDKVYCSYCGSAIAAKVAPTCNLNTCGNSACTSTVYSKQSGVGGKSWYDSRHLSDYSTSNTNTGYAAIRITRLEDVDYVIQSQNQEIKANVMIGATKSEVTDKLGTTVEMLTDQKPITVDVEWDCATYDPEVIGEYIFAGTIRNTAEFIKNPQNIKAQATVMVKELTQSQAIGELQKSVDKIAQAIYATDVNDTSAEAPDKVYVIVGQPFDDWIKCSKKTAGGTDNGITVSASGSVNGYIKISGIVNKTGTTIAEIDGIQFLVIGVPEPNSTNVTVVLK